MSTSAPPMPKVIVPEATRKSFKLKQLHKLTKQQNTFKYPHNTFYSLLYLPMLETQQIWLENFPGDPTCITPASLRHSSNMPETSHIEVSTQQASVLPLTMEVLSGSLHTATHSRKEQEQEKLEKITSELYLQGKWWHKVFNY